MDMRVNRLKLEQWTAVVAEANTSGIVKKDWCRMHQIPERQFYYWQQKVRSYALDSMDQPALPVRPETDGNPAYVEIRQAAKQQSEGDKTNLLQSGHTAGSLPFFLSPEVVIEHNGSRVLVGKETTERTLRLVMKALRDA